MKKELQINWWEILQKKANKSLERHRIMSKSCFKMLLTEQQLETLFLIKKI